MFPPPVGGTLDGDSAMAAICAGYVAVAVVVAVVGVVLDRRDEARQLRERFCPWKAYWLGLARECDARERGDCTVWAYGAAYHAMQRVGVKG